MIFNANRRGPRRRSGPRGRVALEGAMRERTVPPKPPKAPERGKKTRLADALRANLARRKAQKRAREAAGQGNGQG